MVVFETLSKGTGFAYRLVRNRQLAAVGIRNHQVARSSPCCTAGEHFSLSFTLPPGLGQLSPAKRPSMTPDLAGLPFWSWLAYLSPLRAFAALRDRHRGA